MNQQFPPYGSVYGEEHVIERLLATQYLVQLHYSYGALFTPDLLEQEWGEMFHFYQRHVGGGVHGIIQVGKKGMTREELMAMALTPGKDTRPEWSYRNTFNMTADSGFRQARFRPRSKSGWEQARSRLRCRMGWGRSRRVLGIGKRNKIPRIIIGPTNCNPHILLRRSFRLMNFALRGPMCPSRTVFESVGAIPLGQDAQRVRNVLTTSRRLGWGICIGWANRS